MDVYEVTEHRRPILSPRAPHEAAKTSAAQSPDTRTLTRIRESHILVCMFGRLRSWISLTRYKMKGLQIADDCRFSGIPDFGSEPYLISIGKHVAIGSGVIFLTHDGGTFVFRQLPEYKRVISYGRITIFDNCMIGMGATILQGVSIGPNAIVGARSVVTKDVPANTVVAGVPARPLMSTEEYAEKCLRNTPAYDERAYWKDKRAELLRIFPRPW